jgi:hypothetical protein
VHGDGVEGEIPVLANRIPRVDGHRLSPGLSLIRELQGSHSP